MGGRDCAMLCGSRVLLLLAASMAGSRGQIPSRGWTPNSESIGTYCYKDARNPNDPGGQAHDGGCGCENTLMRLDGRLIMMESSEHGCEIVFPGYNSTTEGDCSYFRLRDALAGSVIANVSGSLRHSFFAAVADHARRTVWVFGSAHARGNAVRPNACDIKPTRGCYVGVWNASFDDLTAWSAGEVALTLPDGYALFNNDVTLVSGPLAPEGPGLPKHQAAMVIEQRTDDHTKYPYIPPFAVNVGADGDLSRNWVLLNDSQFNFDYPKGAAGEGTGDAPALRFDPQGGYYYSIGGGWITNGPARSRNLTHWVVSPRAPMAVPDAIAHQAGLPSTDTSAGINTAFYSKIWADGVPGAVAEWQQNLSSWNWGATDPDLCCSDGVGPSYLLNTLSRQGAPANFTGKTYGFSRFRESKLELYAWLRSYFE